MTEEIYNMPDDFYDGKPADTNIYFYKVTQSSKNNRIIFRQNLLCFLLEGQKQVLSGNDQALIDNSQVLLLQTGNVLMSEKTATNNSFKNILLFFSDRFLLNFVSEKEIKTNTTGVRSKTMITLPKDNYIQNFENSLLLLETSLNKNKELAVAKLEEILLYLLERNSSEITGFIKNAVDRNKHISFTEIIKRYASQGLRIDELAFLCNMSTSTFKRKFSEVYNTTPKQYFIEQKMNKAVFLLKQNKRPSEIYFELGYENLSAFSNEFKKHFGISPRTYILQTLSY